MVSGRGGGLWEFLSQSVGWGGSVRWARPYGRDRAQGRVLVSCLLSFPIAVSLVSVLCLSLSLFCLFYVCLLSIFVCFLSVFVCLVVGGGGRGRE